MKLPGLATTVGLIMLAGCAAGAVVAYNAWLEARIGAGFAAKQICSCLFVADREYDSCLTDLPPQLQGADFTFIDRSVIVNAYGLAHARADLKPGYGCSLQNFSGGGF
jgi:hypothetical protein